jgi:hypothetical protein
MLLLITGLVAAAPDGGVASGRAGGGWAATSGGVTVRWVVDQLTAERDGGTRLVERLRLSSSDCVGPGLTGRASSLVGPLLSWLTVTSGTAGARTRRAAPSSAPSTSAPAERPTCCHSSEGKR